MFGGDERARTADLCRAKAALSQTELRPHASGAEGAREHEGFCLRAGGLSIERGGLTDAMASDRLEGTGDGRCAAHSPRPRRHDIEGGGDGRHRCRDTARVRGRDHEGFPVVADAGGGPCGDRHWASCCSRARGDDGDLVWFIALYWVVTGVISIVSLLWDRTQWGWKLIWGLISVLAGWFILTEHLIVAAAGPWQS